MGKESIFQSALSNFIFEFTCGGAIRHLADQGLTVKQIAGRLSFPLPCERVRQAVTDYFLEKGILLRSEPVRGGKTQRYTYVQDHGAYGKVSFRRVPVNSETESDKSGAGDAEKTWTERLVTCGELAALLKNKKRGSQSESRHGSQHGSRSGDYAACAFGATGTEFEGYEALNERQQEYLQGICWDRRTMYHLLDPRMTEIVIKLCESNFWRGKVYIGDMRTILTPEQNSVGEESGETEDGFI